MGMQCNSQILDYIPTTPRRTCRRARWAGAYIIKDFPGARTDPDGIICLCIFRAWFICLKTFIVISDITNYMMTNDALGPYELLGRRMSWAWIWSGLIRHVWSTRTWWNVTVCTLGASGEEWRSRPSSKPKPLAWRSLNARMYVDNNDDAGD